MQRGSGRTRDDDRASPQAPGLQCPELLQVLESAARLQQIVPDAVLVGGSAAALWANHRSSRDHGHVLADLGDIESGVRQLIRNEPLEVCEVILPSGRKLRVPTPDETLRIKGYLIVRRNLVRDYIDVAALSDRYRIQHAAE